MNTEKKQQFSKGVFLFIIGCVFGYLFETVLCLFQFGQYESRKGLIYGPFNVIYGFAFLFAPILLKKHVGSPWKLFLLSFCYGGIYEYLCSWIQETFFGTISWDYTNQLFNFDGRTSLFMMATWALIGFIFMRFCYPYLLKNIRKINVHYAFPIAVILSLFLVFDIALSSLAMIREQMRLQGREAFTFVGTWIDRTYPSSFLDEIYPHRMDPVTKKELRINPKLHQESSSVKNRST